ncbi:hypothetical protein FXE78_01645 [Vibrio mimicus]|nr:hypothetical protein FXE86_02085 [Vibrio mimicus]TXY48204.1 hypothetical protein FXE78_01645 [Vibrio mimicus]
MGQWQQGPLQYVELLSSFLSVSCSKIAIQFACKAWVGKAPLSHLSPYYLKLQRYPYCYSTQLFGDTQLAWR